MSGVLSAGKKRGPFPSFFPPPPHSPFLGLFSALICNGIAAKRGKKVKNGQILIRREDPRLIAFDHFLNLEFLLKIIEEMLADMYECLNLAKYH
jgi:hypothetical protein